MYVGTLNGTVIVVNNEIVEKQFDGCNGNYGVLGYIIFDQWGYMATSCDDSINHKLYLYYSNGTFTGTSISTPDHPRYIGFDLNRRFIQISSTQISIYN